MLGGGSATGALPTAGSDASCARASASPKASSIAPGRNIRSFISRFGFRRGLGCWFGFRLGGIGFRGGTGRTFARLGGIAFRFLVALAAVIGDVETRALENQTGPGA